MYHHSRFKLSFLKKKVGKPVTSKRSSASFQEIAVEIWFKLDEVNPSFNQLYIKQCMTQFHLDQNISECCLPPPEEKKLISPDAGGNIKMNIIIIKNAR